jgi:arylsulfatase A-like enzyme
MKIMKIIKFIFLLVIVSVVFFSGCKETEEPKQLTLFVVFDGLRPDYLTPEIMPNTYRLKLAGALANKHHSTFPTLTRVNSAAIASGAYPATNGVMGNSVYFPSIEPSRGLNSGDAAELMRILEHPNEKLFTSPTLADVLKKNGKNLMVFSTGSTGQSLLLNHLAGTFGAIVNPQFILPEDFKSELETVIGAIPSSDKGNMSRHTWITDAYLHYGLSDDAPEVSILWFNDPDGTAHATGVGSPETLASITYVDNELGRVIADLEKKGMKDRVNILIGTDHGFVTHIGKNNITTFLIDANLKEGSDSEDVVVAGGAIYVKDKSKVEAIANALMQQEWIGAVFTAPTNIDSAAGIVEGTLSLGIAKFAHKDRSPDILVDMAWMEDENEFGYAGTSFSRGIAGHGGSSPYEMSIKLIGYGPGFKTNSVSFLASGNVDIVPTILYLQGLEIPKEMDGRILFELMNDKNAEVIISEERVYSVSNQVKKQEARIMGTGSYWYLSSILTAVD